MIWLDVDCVIADFIGAMEKKLGVLEPGFGYELGGTFLKEHGICWLELERTPWAIGLRDHVRSTGLEYAYLTNCIHEDRAFWLGWFDPGCRIVCTNDKGVVVRKDDILVDDRDDGLDCHLVRVPAKWYTAVRTSDEVLTGIIKGIEEWRTKCIRS